MALFSNADITKHNYQYVLAVLDDIDSGVLKFDIDSDFTKHTRNIIKQQNDNLLKECLKVINWTKIDKSPYSGKGGSRTPPVTDESEQAVIIFLDMFINGIQPEDFEIIFLKYLDDYSPKNVILDNSHIKKTINFLKENHQWAAACWGSAHTIFNYFGNLKDYNLHQNTIEFNTIRSLGSKLSGLKADKWNPADIYLIKKSFQVNTLKKLTLSELNNLIAEDNAIIGISLKKSQEGANHGKSTIAHSAKLKNINLIPAPKIVKDGKLTTGGVTLLKAQAREVKQTLGKLAFYRKTDGSITQQIENAKIKSDNFQKSIPVILDWISKHKNDDDFIDSVIFLSLNALSLNPLSCSYLKCLGADKVIKKIGEKPEITVSKVKLKFNGEIDLIIDIRVNKTPYKAQVRSFGSIPQLELKNRDKVGDWVNL